MLPQKIIEAPSCVSSLHHFQTLDKRKAEESKNILKAWTKLPGWQCLVFLYLTAEDVGFDEIYKIMNLWNTISMMFKVSGE